MYDWKITFYVVGGLCLICCFMGALLRPLEFKNDEIIIDASHQLPLYKLKSRIKVTFCQKIVVCPEDQM